MNLLKCGCLQAAITLLYLMIFSLPSYAASDIGSVSIVQNQCGKITLNVTLNSSWKVMPANSKPTYIVSRIVDRTEQTDVKTSNDPAIPVEWPEGTYFKFHVTARSRQTSYLGITMYRKVGEIEGISANCSSYVPLPGEVRLRHEKTGKCLFGNPNDGGPAATWTCWKDPNMGYFLDTVSGNEVRLRHRSTGKCLYGDSVNGGVAKNWGCWNDPNMIFIKDALPGANRFRLRQAGVFMVAIATDLRFKAGGRAGMIRIWCGSSSRFRAAGRRK
jgi:hypothetical protein